MPWPVLLWWPAWHLQRRIVCMLWGGSLGFHIHPLLYNTISSVSVLKPGHGPRLSPIQLGCLLWSWKVLNAPVRMQSEAWAATINMVWRTAGSSPVVADSNKDFREWTAVCSALQTVCLRIQHYMDLVCSSPRWGMSCLNSHQLHAGLLGHAMLGSLTRLYDLTVWAPSSRCVVWQQLLQQVVWQQ